MIYEDQVIEDAEIVEAVPLEGEHVPVDNKNLVTKDIDTEVPVSQLSIGDIFPLKGIWCRIVAFQDNHIILRPEVYTSKRVKRMIRRQKSKKK